jgi:GNAT superfamily N-acetyltransferase
MITIRRMTEADDLAASRIAEACYRCVAGPDHLTDEELHGGICEYCTPQYMSLSRVKFIAIVAELDGNLVGLAATRENRIQEMFVDPDYHRQGVGTALFRSAEQTVAAAGYSAIKVKTMSSALSFYMRMGMLQTGTHTIQGDSPWAGRELLVLEKGTGP